MLNPNFSLTRKALQDIASIWEYTVFNWSERQAETYYQTLLEVCEMIGMQPSIGQRYPEIKDDIFGFKSGKHIVFYKVIENNHVLIVRILHERIDLKSKFHKD